MKAVFAAGGTGGHINPALAIADKIKETLPDTEILFIGNPEGLEARLVTEAGYRFKGVKMAGFQRKISPSAIAHNVGAVKCYLSAGKAVKKILNEEKPDIVIGTGGYVTGTVLKAALKCKVKTAIHESNSLPGVSVKLLCDKVDLVMLGSKDAMQHLKFTENCKVTGNPLRNNIPITDREQAKKKLGLPNCFTVLSIGGSQGAAKINGAVAGLLKREQDSKDINHIHGFGKHGRDDFLAMTKELGADTDYPQFILKEYINNMYTCICAADLVITRAGAMTLTELAAVGRASVTVPYPYAAENHQFYNALTLQSIGASTIIEDKDLTADKLWKIITELKSNPKKQAEMEKASASLASPDAAGKILSLILDLIKKV